MNDSDQKEVLDLAIHRAREFLEASQEGILPPTKTWPIKLAFGPRKIGAGFDLPKIRRLTLALASATLALDLLQKRESEISVFEAALEAARHAKERARDELHKLLDTTLENTDALGSTESYLAGQSVSSALVCALEDDFFFEASAQGPVPEDVQTGGDDNDAASFLAAAIAKIAEEEGADPILARREFWRWWLDTAVPNAWNAVA